MLQRFIFQKEFSINYERNRVQETKVYHVYDEAEILRSAHKIVKAAAIILNPILLRPFDIELQMRAFFIMRRMLLTFPQYIEFIRQPLNLVLTNIAVYSVTIPTQKYFANV